MGHCPASQIQGFRPERADFGPEKADSRPERADSRTERADSKPERADFRLERAEFRPERDWGTKDRTNGRTNISPRVLQDFVPFRAAAQKVDSG